MEVLFIKLNKLKYLCNCDEAGLDNKTGFF